MVRLPHALLSNHMSQSQTLSTGSLNVHTGELLAHGPRPALVVLWSAEEPERVGEVLLIPPSTSGRPWLFGRGPGTPEDPGERLEFLRQRPGQSTFTGPIRATRISRQQLLIEECEPGVLSIRNSGRRRLLHQGQLVEQTRVSAGDVLELEQQLLLLCTQRPAVLPELAQVPGVVPPKFGTVDDHGLLGESSAIWEVRRLFAQASAQDTHVLVQGPSGSGKELAARAIHALSARRHRSLVSRNAATFPETLIDAELFGNIRHYPNSGSPERPGLIGEADGSFLYLDEIGELPVALQTRLLRVLDLGEYQRLGDSRSRRSDFRLLAATHRRLEVLRHDVLARFPVRLRMPGLDERREDIPLLASHLLRRLASTDPSIAARFFSGASTAGHPRLAPALVSALVWTPYETHIRELEYLLRKCIEASPGSVVVPCAELEERRLASVAKSASGSQACPPPAPLPRAPKEEGPSQREGLERQIFTDEQRHLLMLQRGHGFNMSACGRDPSYPGVRQTATRHIRILLAKALFALDWQVPQAVALVAGTDEVGPLATLHDEACARVQHKLEGFLESLHERIPALPGSAAALQESLREEYGADAVHIFRVLGALQQGALRGCEQPGRGLPAWKALD